MCWSSGVGTEKGPKLEILNCDVPNANKVEGSQLGNHGRIAGIQFFLLRFCRRPSTSSDINMMLME